MKSNKKNKQTSQNKHTHKNLSKPTESVLHWSTTSDHGAWPGVCHTVGENWFFLCQQLSVACWLGVGFHVHFPFPIMEFCVSWMCTGLETYFKENLWVCVSVGTRVPPCLCGSQKTVLQSCFSPSTLRNPDTKLTSSGLRTNVYPQTRSLANLCFSHWVCNYLLCQQQEPNSP